MTPEMMKELAENGVTLFIIIYQSIMLPFGLAFGSNDTTVIDILMSCIFATDILVGFNTPYADDVDEAEYIIDRWQIASNYLRGWFLFDLLACLPFDYVLLLINNSKSNLNILGLLKSLLVIMGQNITVYDDSEYFFCVLVMVVGAVLMAVVFGNVAILIANYYESQSSYQKKMEWLFASMNRMKLPYELQNRINAYYQAMWERHGTLDGAVTAFIPELSRNLAYEVELFLRMDMINRAPIFQNCSTKVVQELVMELELQVFMPGDYVVVRGEVGNDINHTKLTMHRKPKMHNQGKDNRPRNLQDQVK
ncbi:hypothetical protein BBO99_00008737 [Phytophthora kernoviae]|uniref:Cyclic nucleotide-binding domain-containing protein n=2 Tax=Phytophthora kernoviae TaxID=325452 RepID=A0A3R7JZN5_9STRA|nr:hypothetical protein G195_010249 [Phytophthora kernoviae 00238/432]KAG2510436.1 hypothetical protein JM16_008539 [Phytophthora kernoviae]KAG2512423.1 hypothetical protein JM18_008558 [Phytophthora kernoviae]RLN38180.1 hypothetical protein BBI17_008755 [Phytophthora kernoviae]RLN74797.1 hypothetical protein BBO99_00008737 [Phytophthora kernoviae]